MTATTAAPERVRVQLSANAFFVWMAFACVAIAFGGFSIEYWASTAAGNLAVPAIYHVHGVLYSAWTIFLWVQAMFISNGQPARHRRSGLVGVSIATGMVFSGLLIAMSRIRNDVAHGFGDAAMTFSVVQVTALGLFAILVIAALVVASDRDTHKRLMLVATISILEAPIARVFKALMAPAEILALPIRDQPPPMLQLTIGPYIVCDLMILVAMAYDWRTRGKPHPAYLISGLALVVVQLGRFALGPTPAWHAFAQWMMSLVG
jgi:hypothetical protein